MRPEDAGFLQDAGGKAWPYDLAGSLVISPDIILGGLFLPASLPRHWATPLDLQQNFPTECPFGRKGLWFPPPPLFKPGLFFPNTHALFLRK